MSSCHHLPVLLIFDFSVNAIYHSAVCGDKLTSNEVEKFISDFNGGKLTPTGQLNADDTLTPYTGKFWWGKICELFTKIFLANSHTYTKNVFGISTDCSLSAKFFLTDSFYLYDSPKFFPTKYFLCTVLTMVTIYSTF